MKSPPFRIRRKNSHPVKDTSDALQETAPLKVLQRSRTVVKVILEFLWTSKSRRSSEKCVKELRVENAELSAEPQIHFNHLPGNRVSKALMSSVMIHLPVAWERL